MRIGILSSMMALLAGVGSALAQTPDGPAASQPYAGTGSTATAPAAPGSLSPALTCGPTSNCAGRPNCGDPGPNYGHTNGLPEFGPGFGPCPMGNCLYGSAEYLLWKIKDSPLPPNQLIVPFTVSGLTTFQSNFTFADGGAIEYSGRSGGRFTIGGWVCPDQLLGIEATYFQFERSNNNFGGTQVSDLPVNLTVTQNITMTSAMATTISQVPLNITLPGQLTTTVLGSMGPSNFWGVELNARSTRCFFGGASFDLIGGFRYLEFAEQFNLLENINLQVANSINLAGPGPIPPNPLPPIPQPVTGLRPLATITTNDSITTRNQFYGAQVGMSSEWWVAPRFIVSGWGKVGTGAMVQTVRIVGNTITTAAAGVPQPLVAPGGILTPSIGFVDQSRTRYAVIPEFNIGIGYQICKGVRATVGYNFLYLTTIARPGDQIAFSQTNTNIAVAGTATAVTVNQPTFRYVDTDLWAQGLTAGFSIRY